MKKNKQKPKKHMQYKWESCWLKIIVIFTIILHLVCAGLLLTVSINSHISVPGEFLE